MNLKEIKDGDRLLINGHSFVSKAIRYFMRLYAKKYGTTPEYEKMNLEGWVASHAATFHWIGDTLYLFESIEKGYKPTIFLEQYNPNTADYIVIRNKRPMTEWQRARQLKFGLHLIEKSILYEYWALIFWIIYIVFRINLFGRGGSDSMYCYEGAYREAKHIYPDDFKKRSEIISFYDLFSRNDKIVVDHRVNN